VVDAGEGKIEQEILKLYKWRGSIKGMTACKRKKGRKKGTATRSSEPKKILIHKEN